MDQFDGRGLGAGIAGGVVVGLVVFYFADNPNWIYLFAVVGAVVGMNSKWFSGRK